MKRVSVLLILTLLPGFLMLSISAYGQEANPPAQKLLSAKYQGSYSYSGADGMGVITVYPETDTTVVFYIDLLAPASNKSGSLYGRVLLNDETGTFETALPGAGSGCKWEFTFSRDSLSIRTVAGYNDCGMGAEASADGVYKKLSGRSPDYFSRAGKKVYYNETKPEDFHKRITISVENNSRYIIKQLDLKNAGSSVYFTDIKPGNLSAVKALSVQGDSGSLIVQLLRKRFLRRAKFMIIKQNILLNISSDKQRDLTQGGNYILRIDRPQKKEFTLQTVLEKLPVR